MKIPSPAALVRRNDKVEWREAARRLGKQIQYYRGLYRDKRTPRRAKWALGLALAYFFSPFDIIPDFVPVLGQLDDIVVVPFLFNLANRAIPEEVKAHYRAKYLED